MHTKIHTMFTIIHLKRLILLFILFFYSTLNGFSQSFPSEIRTEYTQLFLNDRSGKSSTSTPEKDCMKFTFINDVVMGKDCITGKLHENNPFPFFKHYFF